MGGLIAWLIVGLIAGAAARLLVPGEDPMSVPQTILLGLVGSIVGGFIFNLLSGNGIDFSPAGLIGSIVGAIVALLVWRRVKARA